MLQGSWIAPLFFFLCNKIRLSRKEGHFIMVVGDFFLLSLFAISVLGCASSEI